MTLIDKTKIISLSELNRHTEYYYTRCKCGKYICKEVVSIIFNPSETLPSIEIKCEKCIKDPCYQSHLETEDKNNRIKWNKVPYFFDKNELEKDIFELLSELYSCNKVKEDVGKPNWELENHIKYCLYLLINYIVSYCYKNRDEDINKQPFNYKDYRNYTDEEIKEIAKHLIKERKDTFFKTFRDKKVAHRDKNCHQALKEIRSQSPEEINLYNECFEICRILFQYSSKEEMYPQLFNLDVYEFYKNALLADDSVYITAK